MVPALKERDRQIPGPHHPVSLDDNYRLMHEQASTLAHTGAHTTQIQEVWPEQQRDLQRQKKTNGLKGGTLTGTFWVRVRQLTCNSLYTAWA